MIKNTKRKKQIDFFYLYHDYAVCFSLSTYSMRSQQQPCSPFELFEIPSKSSFRYGRTIIKASEAFNRCGVRNYLLYVPAFKPRQDRTVDNVIAHWTLGLKSFFIIPKEITYEWFGELVREINEIDLENGTRGTQFVTRDGDSFIQNVLTPNVEQVCQNVCVPRGNLDGSLIEMFMAGANMITSESVMKSWQALIKETIAKCSCAKEEEKEEKEAAAEEECAEDPTCDCGMCDFYRDDSYSRSAGTTDCSGDPFYNSDTDSDWE